MEPVDHWKAAISAVNDVVAQVGDDQWAAPTPCPDWTVRELVDHVAWWQGQTTGQLDAPDAIATPLGDDPGAAWTAIQGALVAAVDAEGALDQLMASPFWPEPVPFSEGLMLPTIDLMYHAWDLARAIGADDTLPEATAAACHEVMLPYDDAIRASTGAYPDGYADKIDPPAGADAQTMFLCFGGRQP